MPTTNVASSPAYPVPQHTLDFVKSASLQTLQKIFASFGVRLAVQSIPKAELEIRLIILLSDSQRLSQVLPLSKTDYASLKPWDVSKKGSLPKAYAVSGTVNQGVMRNATGSYRENGENPFEDVNESFRALGMGFEIGATVAIFQDPQQQSAILFRTVEVRKSLLDNELPMLFVFFHHETWDNMTIDSQAYKWLQEQSLHSKNVAQIDASLGEQHLLLRQLIYNSRRLPPGCEAMFERSRKLHEETFIPSFVLPLDALQGRALDYLNRAGDVCENCKKPASSLCGACGIVAYCSVECQRKHRASHLSFCAKISGSKTVTAAMVSPNASMSDAVGSPLNYWSRIGVGQGSMRDMLRTVPQSGETDDLGSFKSKIGTKARFIIKVQTALGKHQMPLMIYDSARNFTRTLSAQSNPYAYTEVLKLVHDNVRWGGMKGYFYAKLTEKKDELEIMTSVFPHQEQRW